MSFAAIGAIVAGHLGNGSPLVLVAVAARDRRPVGALVALPAFRLSGIYLALATAAFAVMLDGWIFKLPAVHVRPAHPVHRHHDLPPPARRVPGRQPRRGPLLRPRHRRHRRPRVPRVERVRVRPARAPRGVAAAQRPRPPPHRPQGQPGRLRHPRHRTTGSPRSAVFAFSAGMAGVGGAIYGAAHPTAGTGRLRLLPGPRHPGRPRDPGRQLPGRRRRRRALRRRARPRQPLPLAGRARRP